MSIPIEGVRKMSTKLTKVAIFCLCFMIAVRISWKSCPVFNTSSNNRKLIVKAVRSSDQRATLPMIAGKTTSYQATHVTKECNTNLKVAKRYSQSQEDEALFLNYFNSPQICGGTYVEIGALDGKTYSNTKFFEDNLGWGGVLIEAQPENAKKLKQNRSSGRNHIISEAVCSDGQRYVNFTGENAVGGIEDQMTKEHKKHFLSGTGVKTIQVPCRPIGEMLSAAGVRAVDFFILDVEGAELMVLETMDWSIPVKVFVVEMGRGEKDKKLIDLLRSKGYTKSQWNIRGFCLQGHDCTNNQVFEHEDYTYSFLK